MVESLESRKLLTSVSGGEIGVFQGANGQPVKIDLGGSGSLDFIGATRDEFGNAQLNDIPMTIFDKATKQVVRENLGGYAGRNGIQLADKVFGDGSSPDSLFVAPIDPNLPPNMQSPYVNVPSGRVSLDGLAANFKGKTYGLNEYHTAPDSPVLDVLRVDSGEGNVQIDSEISDQVLAQLQTVKPEFAKSDIINIIGADFPPNDANNMYFALNVNYPTVTGTAPNTTLTHKQTPAMFIYNIATKRVTIDPLLFGFTNPDTDTIRIDDFTFLDNGQIAMFGSVALGNATPSVGLFTSDADAVIASPDQVIPVVIGVQLPGQQLPAASTSFAAIEAIPGENEIVAVTNNAGDTGTSASDAQLVRFSPTTGRGIVLGSVVDPNAPADQTTRLGGNIRDLAWNSRVTDHYFEPGKRGGLLGSDGSFDTLVALDIRQRFQNSDLYAIYGNHVTSDTTASIAAFTPDSDSTKSFNRQLFDGVMDPYSGSAGSIRTTEVPGDPVNISLDNGALYLGLRTADPSATISVPVLGLSSARDFVGSKPGVALPRIVRPGIYLNGSIKSLFFGGTITGGININGSIDTLYAGNIITGDPLGGFDPITQTPSVAVTNTIDNFFVNGDLRNLLVSGGLGTLDAAPDTFAPKTDLLINGRVQQIKAGVYRGSADIAGKRSDASIGSSLTELEATPPLDRQNRDQLAFEGIGSDSGLDIPVSRNDTFNTEQIVGSYYSKSLKKDGQWTLTGTLNNGTNFGDDLDFYGVPLLAGQTFQTQLQSLSGANVFLQVMDPEGRVYATDRSNVNTAAFFNKTLQIKADKPGVWRLVVNPVSSSIAANVDRRYSLTVGNVGQMAIGGLVSLGDAFFDRADLGIKVRTGDLGAIQATSGVVDAQDVITDRGRDQSFGNPILAETGNIRAIDATSLSRLSAGLYSRFPEISAPKGSVGLLRASTFLYFNVDTDALGLNTGGAISDAVVGGDYQVIQAGGDMSGIIAAKGNIGVIRAASWARSIIATPGYISVNADGSGSGELGLIDVPGSFGTFQYGGPVINVGDGGNVRYMRVATDPNTFVYRPRVNGSGNVTVLTGQDTSVRILDDSGAMITITPYDGVAVTSTAVAGSGTGVPDPFGGNGDPDNGDASNGIPDPFGGNGDPDQSTSIPDPFNGANSNSGTTTTTPTIPTDHIVGTLAVSAYPTLNGGSIVYDVECTTGVVITTSKKGGGGSGDITTLNVGTGVTGVPIVDPEANGQSDFTKPTALPALAEGSGTSLDILLTSGNVNVFDIGGESDATASARNYTRILNNTPGEIVNIRANDIGYLAAQYIGVARPVGGVALEGLRVATDSRFTDVPTTAPFNQLKNAVFIHSAIDIRSRGPIGNVVTNGIVQDIEANSDNVNDKKVLEGIVGPILSIASDNSTVTGFRRIDIGEGLLSSGSGDVAFGGIYATGTDAATDVTAVGAGARSSIGLITNDNGHGDLRGDVIGEEYIEGIRLSGGGSIIDADIIQAAGRTAVDADGNVVGIGSENILITTDALFNFTNLDELQGIGDIRTAGNGGIISSRITGFNIGKITVDKYGFGLINSLIESDGAGTMDGLSIGGLGIRNTMYTGGSKIGSIVATGTGSVLDIRNFSKSVRQDEFGSFDTSTGITPNSSNDLNLTLGTTKKLTKIEGVTNSGVIQNSVITATRSIDSVKAFEIRGTPEDGVSPVTGLSSAGSRPRDASYPMQINFAQSIGSITVGRNLNGARITGGTIGTLSAGRDMTQLEVRANNRVKTISAGRNILGTADFGLTGNGSIDTFKAGGNVNGTVYAPKGIRSVIIGGKLGSAKAQGGIRSGTDINLLQVGGDIVTNGYVRAGKSIKTIILGGSLQAGATIRATSFGTQKIKGDIFGDIIRG